MAQQHGLEFAELLRRLRGQAGLTQEELAEAARLSPRSVSDLERGVHRSAHKDTAQQLADALVLAEPMRALFVAAARGRGSTAPMPRRENGTKRCRGRCYQDLAARQYQLHRPRGENWRACSRR